MDSEQIIAGEDILERLGQGLQTMDALVALISAAALDSIWIDLELKSAFMREIKEKRAMVLPFIIDDTTRDRLPWFLRHRNAPRITKDEAGADKIAQAVKQTIKRRIDGISSTQPGLFKGDPRIDKMLAHISLGVWHTAQDAALAMLTLTVETGQNELFETLLLYLDCPDVDLRGQAAMVIQSFAQLAPWLIDRELLIRMANHKDFNIRSSAAVIYFELAQFAPERVPVDILIKLARHNEDWYVMTPATAALKTMARSRPSIVRVFFAGLRSQDASARENASQAIADIAERDPDILERENLEQELSRLKEMHDDQAVDNITKAISKVQKSSTQNRYKYWPF
jgi:hypothetical protein